MGVPAGSSPTEEPGQSIVRLWVSDATQQEANVVVALDEEKGRSRGRGLGCSRSVAFQGMEYLHGRGVLVVRMKGGDQNRPLRQSSPENQGLRCG